MPNPFFYGGRVEPALFVGRQLELRAIFGCLEIAHTGQLQSVSVVGPHRMGRSSLLYYVAAQHERFLQTASSYRVAYISLHDAECHSPGGLLQKILRELHISTGGGKVSPAEFQHAIQTIRSKGLHPVVCLDEFEELIQTGAFDNAFFDSWRFLMSDSHIAFVIASTRPLSELVAPDKYTSSFFNIFTIVELGVFSAPEAELLVQRGQVCDQPFTDEDCRQMRMLGQGHPYKLQVAGEKIYSAKDQSAGMNWPQVKRAFARQMRQAGLLAKPSNWLLACFQTLLAFMRSVGRAILAVRRAKDEISDDMALWWGLGMLTVAILFALGIFQFAWLTKLISHWLGK